MSITVELMNFCPVLFGFPPKELTSSDETSLTSANIRSGESLVLKNVELQEMVLKKHDIPADNSCLFHAIRLRRRSPTQAACLMATICRFALGCSDGPAEMRRVVASTIAMKPDEFPDAVLGRASEDYRRWILQDSSWGGEIELCILAEYFKCEIVAVDVRSRQQHRYGETFPQRIFLCMSSLRYRYRFLPTFDTVYDGIHFDVITRQFPSCSRMSVFSSTDASACELVTALAKRAFDVQNIYSVVVVASLPYPTRRLRRVEASPTSLASRFAATFVREDSSVTRRRLNMHKTVDTIGSANTDRYSLEDVDCFIFVHIAIDH